VAKEEPNGAKQNQMQWYFAEGNKKYILVFFGAQLRGSDWPAEDLGSHMVWSYIYL